ncbi:MAG: hypothetical protein WCD72_06500 [Dehalococcoidia bacterium]
MVVVDTAAEIAEPVVDTAAGTAVVGVAVLANLAVFDSCYKTLLQRLPERRTWDTDTTAASQPHAVSKNSPMR